jgi:multicomponent Na+:H+ antiporter subunit E
MSDAPRAHFRLVPALRFALRTGWDLVLANVVVAWEVLTPTNRIEEAVLRVDLPATPRSVLGLLTNVIGLTPGTLVVEVEEEPCTLYVHVLHLQDRETTRAELEELCRLAEAAFGAPGAAAAIGSERESRS